MKAAFFTALTFAITIALMGIFFGFMIFHTGTEIRQINTNFLLILGMMIVAGVGAIIFATPVLNPNFWKNLNDQKKALTDIYEEKRRLTELREAFEQLIIQKRNESRD